MARNYSNVVSGSITLTAGMDAVQTTATVSDASTFPTVDFVVQVDDEVMLVTGVAVNTLTVRRGFDGTSPAAHSSGAAVRHVVVAADVGKPLVYGPMVANEPTTESDPMDDLFDDGTIAGKWTQRNAGAAATWTEGADGLWYTVPADTGGLKAIVQTAPVGDFRVEAAYHIGDILRVLDQVPVGLLVSRAAGTASDVQWLQYYIGSGDPLLVAQRRSSYATFVANDATVNASPHEWGLMAFQRAGSEWRFEWSRTGRVWYRIRTVAEPWTVVEVGLALNPDNATYGMSSGFRWFRRVS